REDREARERRAAEEVEQPEDGPALATEVAVDRRGVDARRGHPRAEPVDREDPGGEEDTPPELRDAPCVGEPGEQRTTPRPRARARAGARRPARALRRLRAPRPPARLRPVLRDACAPS